MNPQQPIPQPAQPQMPPAPQPVQPIQPQMPPAPQPAMPQPMPTPQPTPAPQPMPAGATGDALRGPAGPEPQASGTDGRYNAAGPVAPTVPVTTGPVAPVTPAAPQPAAQTTVTPDVPTSTQSTLLISELRDGLVIMKDGGFRAVIACQSINFDLMSSSEREGVEYSYQNFLNSLNFTTQILIRSQRIDIAPYIERLSNIRKNNENMLLGVLMDDYINFIDILSQEANIMDKSFFIVIPYYPDANAEKALQQVKGLFGNKKKTPEVTKIDRATYDKAITEINNRVETVVSGLFQIGIHSVRLNTKELAALYYNFNNPDTAVREPLVDFGKIATTFVTKGEGESENAQEK